MFISGVSTRKIENVLHELGVAQMSKTQVSVCAQSSIRKCRPFASAASALVDGFWFDTTLLASSRLLGFFKKIASTRAASSNFRIP